MTDHPIYEYLFLGFIFAILMAVGVYSSSPAPSSIVMKARREKEREDEQRDRDLKDAKIEYLRTKISVMKRGA